MRGWRRSSGSWRIEWRIDEAAAALTQLGRGRSREPEVELVRGELQFLQGDYEAAALHRHAIGAGGAAQPVGGGAGGAERWRSLPLTAEVTRGFVEQRSPAATSSSVSAAAAMPYGTSPAKRWESPRRPGLRLRRHIRRRCGPAKATPVRVEIHDEVADLARVSTLTLREIETSGTIALCKWNRLMIVRPGPGPRLPVAGYADPRVHALYRLPGVAQLRADLAARGLAKFEERALARTGGRRTVAVDGAPLAVALNKALHHVRADVPSMCQAAVAGRHRAGFAEVYGRRVPYMAKLGWAGLRGFAELEGGTPDQRALAAVVYGAPFSAFDRAWKGWLRGRKVQVAGRAFHRQESSKGAAGTESRRRPAMRG